MKTRRRNIFKKKLRNQRAMSLAAVMGLGVVLSLFASALLQTMMPVLNKVTEFRSAGTARTFADMGLDYVIQNLNAGTAGFDVSSQSGKKSAPIIIPTSDPNAKVTAIVSTLPDAATKDKNGNPTGNPPASSSLYDTLLNGTKTYAYRMVTVTAQYGNSIKQVRCLLAPRKAASTNPYMPYGIFGISSVVFAGQAGFNSYNTVDPRFGADGGSLGKISQVYGGGGPTRSIVQGGSHYEFPDPQSFYAKEFGIVGSLYSAKLAASAPWNTMGGNVYSNGNNTAYYPVAGSGDSLTSANPKTWNNDPNFAAHAVYGVDNGILPGIPDGRMNKTIPATGNWSGGLANWNVGPTNSNGVTYSQPSITPTPTGPSSGNTLGSLGAVNMSGVTIQFEAPAAGIPTSLPATLKSGQTYKLAAGPYSIQSLSMAASSNIVISPSAQSAISSGSASPVQLFFSGSNNGSSVVTIDNSSNVNMSGVQNTGINTQGIMGAKDKNGNNMLDSSQVAITPAGGDKSIPSGSTTNPIVEKSGAASQLQMFYDGNTASTVTQNGKPATSYNPSIFLSGNERMIVYAPQTGIMIGSPSVSSNSGPSQLTKDANFYGAVVGGTVGVNSAYDSGGGVFVHYDSNLRPPGMSFIDPWQSVSPYINDAWNGYRAVTWQEALSPNAANPDAAQWNYQ